jgi:ribosomal protein L22
LYPSVEKLEQTLTDDGISGIIFDSLQHNCSVVRESILKHAASSAEKEGFNVTRLKITSVITRVSICTQGS